MTTTVDEHTAEPLRARLVDDVVVYPTLRRDDMPDRLLMGVFDASGALVPDSLLDRCAGERAAPVATDEFEVDPRVAVSEGIYCGPLFNHYGHFLLESLARVWYAQQHPDLPLVWAGWSKWATDVTLRPWQREILDILGVANATRIATIPTRVARLHMPDVGYRYNDWFHPQHATFLASYHGPAQDDTVKLWLSRSRLDKDVRDLNAGTIERRLEASGWTIVHPQQQTVHEQLDHLARAATIAGEEGSAFHSLMLLDNVQGKKLHIMRRLGPEHGNMRTVGEARGFDQEFHSLHGEVVLRAAGRYVTKVSANASEVLDALQVPVPRHEPDAADSDAATVVAAVAEAFSASSYLEAGVTGPSAAAVVGLPRCTAVSPQFPFDPRAYASERLRFVELPIEHYLACFDDPGRYDIIRIAAPTSVDCLRALIGTRVLAHQDTVWLVDLPEDLGQSDQVLLLVDALLPSLELCAFVHEGQRRLLGRRGVGAVLAPTTSALEVRPAGSDARALLARLDVDGLDAAIDALAAAVAKTTVANPDPAVAALAAQNAALRRKVRRLRAEKRQRERSPSGRVRRVIATLRHRGA